MRAVTLNQDGLRPTGRAVWSHPTECATCVSGSSGSTVAVAEPGLEPSPPVPTIGRYRRRWCGLWSRFAIPPPSLWAFGREQVAAEERERPSDDVTRTLVVVQDVEPMPPGRVVEEVELDVRGEGRGDERVDRRVQPRPVLQAGPGQEHRRER